MFEAAAASLRNYLSGDASKISVFSHLLTAYRLAEMGETIPYESALVSTMESTEAIARTARKLDAQAKRFLARARS